MQQPDFELIETMRYEPCYGFLRLELHLQRMRNSSAELGFTFEEGRIRQELQACHDSEQPLRIRLSLAPDGHTAITTTLYQPLPPETVWKLGIATTRLSSANMLLRHKTTARQLYNKARAEFSPNDIDEVLLLNENGELCEGTITSLFVDMGNGVLLTPPLDCGLLNGVLRQELLAQGAVKQARIAVEELQQAHKIFVGNSLRGMINAELVSSYKSARQL